jgi:hypothetical protein
MLFAGGVGIAAVRMRKWNYALPLIWLAVAAIPVVLSDDVMPHALRSLLMTPAVFLLAAIAAWELRSRVRLRAVALAAVATAVLALALCWEPYHTYFDVWAKDPAVEEWFDGPSVQVARRVREKPGENVVLVPLSSPAVAWPAMFITGNKARYVSADVQEIQIAADQPR